VDAGPLDRPAHLTTHVWTSGVITMSANKVKLDEDPCAKAVLALLLGFRNCGALRGRGLKECAVSWPVIQEAAGADAALLKALLRAGLVEAVGGAAAGEPDSQSRLVLTEAGFCLAVEVGTAPAGPRLAAQTCRRTPQPGEKPRWDRAARELWFAGEVVLRFPRGARNQERVLEAFEEQGWPARIDDPLPPEGGVDPVERLRDTVRHLAARLGGAPLRLRQDAEGKAVFWSAVGG
jgi:hypothetical protein